MPYTSGETPEVGDYVKNKWEQPGTVTAVHAAMSGYEQVSIRWDGGLVRHRKNCARSLCGRSSVNPQPFELSKMRPIWCGTHLQLATRSDTDSKVGDAIGQDRIRLTREGTWIISA